MGQIEGVNMGVNTAHTRGDAVNLASHLEELSKVLGTGILISPSTYEQVKAAVQTKRLGQVKIKGKEKSLSVYEVVE